MSPRIPPKGPVSNVRMAYGDAPLISLAQIVTAVPSKLWGWFGGTAPVAFSFAKIPVSQHTFVD